MARRLLGVGAGVAVLGAVLWQVLVRDFVYIILGVGRVTQNIGEFPYTCRAITDNRLSGCEDMWLDDEERILYAACATTEGRLAWNQAVDMLNVSGIREGGTELLAISIDKQLPDQSFPFEAVKLEGYVSPTGDSSAYYLGFDAEYVDQRTVHFYLINQRPPVDAQGKPIDATKIGANASIEIFEHKRGSSSMKHLRTIWDPETVYTPNNVAAIGNGAFLVTNDHSKSLGLRKELDMIIGSDGGVTYCSSSSTCTPLTPPRTFKMANGLARGQEGLIYVPDTLAGTISVYNLTLSAESANLPPTFTLIETIRPGMPLDNLALDHNGDLWIPGFTDGAALLKWIKDPVGVRVPATVWKISRKQGVHTLEKVLEDRASEILNAITVVRHDAKTGRLFMGAVLNEFVVCDPVTPPRGS